MTARRGARACSGFDIRYASQKPRGQASVPQNRWVPSFPHEHDLQQFSDFHPVPGGWRVGRRQGPYYGASLEPRGDRPVPVADKLKNNAQSPRPQRCLALLYGPFFPRSVCTVGGQLDEIGLSRSALRLPKTRSVAWSLRRANGFVTGPTPLGLRLDGHAFRKSGRGEASP